VRSRTGGDLDVESHVAGPVAIDVAAAIGTTRRAVTIGLVIF
jgi:hypothetical protein